MLLYTFFNNMHTPQVNPPETEFKTRKHLLHSHIMKYCFKKQYVLTFCLTRAALEHFFNV